MWSLLAPIRAQKAIFSAFESAPWIPSAVEPACGATKSQLRQPPRTGRNKCGKWYNSGALFALFLLRASLLHACLALYVEQVNERKLVCACVAGAWQSYVETS
jgi:hypothetical protein